MAVRDDFAKTTIEKIAGRVNYHCSKPGCGALTRGPHSDESKVINLGEAAHITAAAPGGPRYDPQLTSKQRKHASNGLWLCRPHAKLVDADDSKFTVEELRRWKRTAEENTFNALASGQRSADRGSVIDDVESTFALLQRLAKDNLSAFQQTAGWPRHPIALHLELVSEAGALPFDVRGLASTIETFDEIALIAPPGTGKTVTLLQLADAILDRGTIVPFFIPLNEWATATDSFFQSILRRRALRDATQGHMDLLAQHGKLALLLDGWNELDGKSRVRVRAQVTELQRDYPDIRIIVSSRFTEFDLPISGPTVKVGSLTFEQQTEIAKALRGADGEALLDHAWRTPGLRELVAIPLYLFVLLKRVSGAVLPSTKEELLRAFATEHEEDARKWEMLRQELQGSHTRILSAIAFEATRQETTALSEERARAVVAHVQEGLMAAKQIVQPLEPLKVLDLLASVHMLVPSGGESSTVEFQHQQFQEWYASLRVEDLILALHRGDDSARNSLRVDVLNLPFWEEAILFACERLSRTSENGAEAVATVVVECLGIDPLLSAEIIYRSSEHVWQRVSKTVVEFAAKWHRGSQIDRAVQFMINTGRPEFSESIWPLISNPDSQVHLPALRAGRAFRPNVLGPNVKQRLAELPEELRSHILSEIANESGMDGIDLAARLASEDRSPRVKIEVADTLQFRHADRALNELLKDAPETVWQGLAGKWDAEEFADAEVRRRIRHEIEAQTQQIDPARSIEKLLRARQRATGTGQRVCELIQQIDFSDRKRDNSWVVQSAYEAYAADTEHALVAVLEAGRPLPYGAAEILRSSASPGIDEGPIPKSVLESSDPEISSVAMSVVGAKTIGSLIDRTLELDPRIAEAQGEERSRLYKEHMRLVDAISQTKPDAFGRAIIERSQTKKVREIALLSDLLSRHGGDVERRAVAFSEEIHKRLTDALIEWTDVLLKAPDSKRSQLAEIPQAAERLRSPALAPVVQALLLEDIKRLRTAQEEQAAARRQGQRLQNDAHMRYGLQYQRAFAAIGGDETVALMKAHLPNSDFGIQAAHVMLSIWARSLPSKSERPSFRSWPDFSVVKEQHAARASGAKPETVQFVDDILEVVEDLCRSDSPQAHKHAVALAQVALSMPYSGKDDLIAALLALPRPTEEKLNLLTTLALSGRVIPSEMVLKGVDELFEDAKKQPWKLYDQDAWRLKSWLKLFPFTDKPGMFLEVFDRLEDQHRAPWGLREVLSAFGDSPSPEAERILGEIARKDPRFLQNHDWLSALTERDSAEAGMVLLELVSSGALEHISKGDKPEFSRSLSSSMSSHGRVRDEVYARYEAMPDGVGRVILERSIADAADTRGILLLVRVAAKQKRSMRATPLYTALRGTLIGRRPSATWSGGHELFGLPAAELRRDLFRILVAETADISGLASEVLVAIDNIRDDYGISEAEPRHPDIQTGVAWPQV